MHRYVTLTANADYVIGAVALARSLQMVKATAPLLVMTLGDWPGLNRLQQLGCEIVQVAPPAFSDDFRRRHTRQAQHADAPFDKGSKPTFHDPLGNFAKLRLWRLERFERVVFLDADTVVLQNIDKLFGYPQFSAAPNLYQSLADFNRLNSGVFVAKPDRRTYDDMLARLDQPHRFWPRTDQSFLGEYFPDWHGLPYIYNALQYLWFNLPALWVWDRLRVVHYQYEKPWQPEHDRRALLQPLIDLWWRIYEDGRLPADLPAAPPPVA